MSGIMESLGIFCNVKVCSMLYYQGLVRFGWFGGPHFFLRSIWTLSVT